MLETAAIRPAERLAHTHTHMHLFPLKTQICGNFLKLHNMVNSLAAAAAAAHQFRIVKHVFKKPA